MLVAANSRKFHNQPLECRESLIPANSLRCVPRCTSAVSISASIHAADPPPAGGIANRAVAGFTNLNQNGPGWLYYGINAADRGLGYNGSYMTLGGFFPGFEDGIGGLWAADVRSHLSTYGGFFSNVSTTSLSGIGCRVETSGIGRARNSRRRRSSSDRGSDRKSTRLNSSHRT